MYLTLMYWRKSRDCFSVSESADQDWRANVRFNEHQIRALLRALAKIHACSFAIKCKTPRFDSRKVQRNFF
jgi:hypothetical protein